jgi:hypothetical protein
MLVHRVERIEGALLQLVEAELGLLERLFALDLQQPVTFSDVWRVVDGAERGECPRWSPTLDRWGGPQVRTFLGASRHRRCTGRGRR